MKELKRLHQGRNPGGDMVQPLAIGDLNHLALRPDRAEHQECRCDRARSRPAQRVTPMADKWGSIFASVASGDKTRCVPP